MLRTVGLHKAIQLAIETLLADLGADLVCNVAPSTTALPEDLGFQILGRTIESDPGHHLRMYEVLGSSAHLPDPLIGLTPGARQMLEEATPECVRPLGRIEPRLQS